VKNEQISSADTGQEYALHEWKRGSIHDEVSILLTFSGGGTRAAALAYGVMQELRDTGIVIDGGSARMLDQVNHISSVSGGSFTAAYYGLHGDGLFETFESDFLRYNIDKQLELQLINPALWFSKTGRTDAAIKIYQDKIFHDATFADMNKPGRPMIVINASDLAYGIRFSFVQEYFDLLCSDLSSFPVARAVAASSAVPVLFEPVVLENYSDCSNDQLAGVVRLREFYQQNQDGSDNARLAALLMSYNDKDKRKFIHFVDGGITDNLGLRALSDIFEVAGGADAFMHNSNQRPPHRMVVIEVNAATQSHREGMDQSSKQPRIHEVMSAVSTLQLERYDWDSVNIVEKNMEKWTEQLSSPQRTVSPYFVQIHLDHVDKKGWKILDDLPFNVKKIPTNFSLSDSQVDLLIEAGRRLLREHPVYQELLSDLETP